LVKSYKNMCRKYNYNFKQPIESVVDFGSDNRSLTYYLRRDFYAKYSFGIPIDKYTISNCEE